jgi:drug/metabolite transporter (DMT)-like permease
MAGGYVLKWLGLIVALIGVLMIIASFGNGDTTTRVLGFICAFGGGFMRYVSRQTVRTK